MMLKLIKTITLPAMLILVGYVNFTDVVRANELTQTRKTNIQPDKNEFGELAGRKSDALKISNIANSPSEITAVPAQDSLALVALYNSTNGPGWFHKDNWLSANPVSTWFGVTVAGGRVVRISIPQNGLNGTIPPKIKDLTKLEQLELSQNNLSGPIPTEIGDLTNLKYLYLHYNNLSGPIPPEIGNLTGLEYLILTRNNLSGLIPPEIGKLRNLQYLELNVNNLTGKVPTGIVNLTNLSGIRINSNQLSDLPDLSHLPHLIYLSIECNCFTFADIEPNIGILNFYYYPQAKVGKTENITEAVGASVTFSVTVGGTANQYQWYKNGLPITGAIYTNYTIHGLDYSDAGTYTCQITNTIARLLTLESHPKNLTVVAGPGSIRVTSPNGGEVWQTGTPYPITWQADRLVGKVKIYISSNGSGSWWDLTQGNATENDGQYVYTPVTQNTSRQCLIKVVATSNSSVQDQSDAVFTIQGNATENLIINGDFSNGDNHWAFYSHAPASATGSVVNRAYVVAIAGIGTQAWHVQLNQYDLNIEHGKKYKVAFDAYATAERTIYTGIGKNASPYTNYNAYEQFTISKSKQTYIYTFTMTEPTDLAARIFFDMGLSTVKVYLDNISLIADESAGFWADADDDGDVDVMDILLVAGRWNIRVGDPKYDPKYDVDNEGVGDGDIDVIDILLVAGWWNKPLPPVMWN